MKSGHEERHRDRSEEYGRPLCRVGHTVLLAQRYLPTPGLSVNAFTFVGSH